MINLFYEESYWMGSNRMTGPRAVIGNLLRSLEDQNIPYARNEEKYENNFIIQFLHAHIKIFNARKIIRHLI